GRAHEARARAEAGRPAGRAGGGARGRRPAGRPHRDGPRADAARRVALPADGQADQHGLVARAPCGDPHGARRPDRVALRLVAADRRLGRGAPAHGPAAGAVLPDPAAGLSGQTCGAFGSGSALTSVSSTGESGVVTSCTFSPATASATASSGLAPLASSSAEAVGLGAGVGGVGAGAGWYDDCHAVLLSSPFNIL